MTTTPSPTPDEQPHPPMPQTPSAPPQYLASGDSFQPKGKSKALGIVAVSLGGAALLLSVIPLLAFPLAIASVICAIVALVRRAGGKVLPLIGIGLSVAALAVGTVLIVITVNLMQQGRLEGF